jgi:hypothetical protein
MTLQKGSVGAKLDLGPKLKTENAEVSISIVPADVGVGASVTEDENFVGTSVGASASVSAGVSGTAKGGGITVSGGLEIVGGFSAKVSAEVCKDGYGARLEGELAVVTGGNVKLGGCVNLSELKTTVKKAKTIASKVYDAYMNLDFFKPDSNANQGGQK